MHADLRDADMGEAVLANSHFVFAKTQGAIVRGANFITADIMQYQINAMKGDEATVLDKFSRPAAW